jgi:hypothetical protein
MQTRHRAKQQTNDSTTQQQKAGESMNHQSSSNAQACLTHTFPCPCPAVPKEIGRKLATIVSCLIVMIVVAGCASTKVTSREQIVTGQIPRPGTIWVYDFSASAADAPADSAFAGQSSTPATPPTEEQLAIGRELGTGITAQLVVAIRELGMNAAQAVPGTQPQVNDIVIRGYLLSVEPGSAGKRMTIGFGSGGSELATGVEGYQMTANGLQKLGSGTINAEGSKGPGAGLGAASWIVTGSPVGLIVGGGMKVYGEASGSAKIEGRAKATAKEIADVMKQRFQEQGWIN